MSEWRENILVEASGDVLKAVKILSEINHNLPTLSSSYMNIIRSCEEILKEVAEELYQLAVIEAKGEK